ncbi:MAG: NusG domain II-containing protein [Candidatus Cloacimonadaceae bacterium]
MKKRIFSRITISDVLLILFCMLAVIFSYSHFKQDKSDQKLYVYKDNELIGIYALKPDREIVIDSHNTLELSGTKVRMLYADCPDKRCVKLGYVQNMPIICMPNKLLCEIKTQEERTKFILH